MKIIKVFSDKQFKNVNFFEGYNVILANIHDTLHKKDTHNLGKTSLLVVIDFLLLGKFDKQHGLLSNPIFSGQFFYIELLLNNGRYLVIKRGISEPSKISFKCSEQALSNFTPPTEWDEERLPLDNAKEKLNEYLGFDILPEYLYRRSISYFLRTQQDYVDVFQLSKFKGKQIDWKPLVFELLGFEGCLIKQKLQIDDDINQEKSKIQTLQQQANIDIAERDKILGLLDVKKQEKKKTEQEIDKFNFYTQDTQTVRELVDSIDADLQRLNAEYYHVSYEIKKINRSLAQQSSTIRLDKLRKLYQEVSLFFPEQLSKQFEDLEHFTESISTERKKYLTENLQHLTIEFNKLDTEIKEKQLERSKKVSSLTADDVYGKFKTCQKQLAATEGELQQLRYKLQLIDQSAAIQEQIESLQEQRKECIAQIQGAINKRAHAEINKIFNEIITEVTGTNAIISIKQIKEGNVQFEADYQKKTTDITTSEGNGTSYKKLLCVAFDLAILIHYSSHSFYRFVYHDGVMEGLDNRIKLRLLEVTQRICQEYNLQYILTIIDSDIPHEKEDNTMMFPTNAVCLELNDKDDNGKLFETSF